MIPDQAFTFIINVALAIIFVLAPIAVVIQRMIRLEEVPDDFVSRAIASVLYTEEMNTANEIRSGKIFYTLFIKSLPFGKFHHFIRTNIVHICLFSLNFNDFSFADIYVIFTTIKNSLCDSLRPAAIRKSNADDTQMSFII